ncbi:non-canonical purine NTP pyrophosphatase [Sorangium sp. So ce1024]|uniref:non-canonical purine NTP pyrophosphatase n=1 Tax=Sorangium sp. So ce1024 TaxID=3133327 RepID=UPI003F0B8B4E
MADPRRIRFVSGNPHKIAESTAILASANVTVVPFNRKIEELQTRDAERLVRDKLLKAFKMLGRPLFVEHTGLDLIHLNGLPGGLTQIFWDALEADKFGELFGPTIGSNEVIARTTIAYCDGKKIHIFRGEITGHIVAPPRGDRSFQWDCVFEPEGHAQTFAEMGTKKNDISMRKRALDEFAAFLASGV